MAMLIKRKPAIQGKKRISLKFTDEGWAGGHPTPHQKVQKTLQ